MGAYEISLAPSALEAILAIPSKVELRHVRSRLEALGRMPHIGTRYDPLYESARPPHDVLATFTGHYGLYYVVDDEAKTVHVEYVEDCRRDPLGKFGS